MNKRVHRAGSLTAAAIGLAIVIPTGGLLHVQLAPTSVQGVPTQQTKQTSSPAESLRSEQGEHTKPDGIHYPWMDDMRRQGVKRAWVVLDTGLSGPPKNWEICEVAYYSRYDRVGSQIIEPGWLGRIRKSGLADELNRVALDRAPLTPWAEHQARLIPIDLVDDEHQPTVTFDEAQKKIREVTEKVSPDSELGRSLARGEHGDGINYFWMDEMRREGVRRAVVSIDIEFSQDGPPKKMKVARVQVYDKYDSEEAQIRDPLRRELIRLSGLDDDLSRIALQRAAQGFWFDLPRPRPDPFVGGTELEFFDDGWLWSPDRPLFTTSPQ
jgi:hypothetical protein